MKLLMISGDRSVLQGKKGAFWYTLEEFSKHWERIDVICPKSQIPGFKSQGSPSLQVPVSKSPFPNVFFHPSPYGLLRQPLWIVKKGKELIAEHHHQVMTVQEYPPFYNGIGAMRLSKATGVPYALEIHHIVGYPKAASYSEYLGRVLSGFFLPWDTRRAKAVRVVNQEAVRVLKTFGVREEKIEVIPSFYLDADFLRSLPSQEKKYDIAFCGRLVANKGLLKVIKAVKLLPPKTLVVIGDGPERARAEFEAKRLGVSDRVTFLGWLPTREEVMAKLMSARVFVMNSVSEGGPRIALEAMACGMPVIATRVGVMPEVIREDENGFFTDGTAEHLAVKLAHFLQNPEMQKTVGTAAKDVLQRFERKKLIAGYAEFLKRVGGA